VSDGSMNSYILKLFSVVNRAQSARRVQGLKVQQFIVHERLSPALNLEHLNF
jgi:hypothetical protein